MSWLITRLGAYLWPAIGLSFLVLLAALGAQTVRLANAHAETAKVQSARDADREQATAAALKQATEYRAEESRRATALQKATDDSERKIAQARADAGAAAGAADRLQSRVAALVAAARTAASNPAAAPVGTPTSDPLGLLADVLRRSDQRAGELAAIADQRGAAGDACVAAYDALKP